MLLQKVVLFFTFCVFSTKSAPTRILVSCDRNGFTCTTIDSKRQVLYQCPAKTQDVLIHLWNYGEPSNTAWLIIQDCENVEIDLSCSSYRRSFESLTIKNVTNLHFTRTVTTIKNPSKIIFRNIDNIPIIPENTFTIPHMMKYNGDVHQHELQEIEFENVNIGTIESHAFNNLRGFRNFTWNNVKVERFHSNAIRVNFNTTMKYTAKFLLANCTIDIMEYLSLQLYTKVATFKENKFVEIMPGGINGTIETFNFFNNLVNGLQSGSMSILSKTVNILDNKFEYLKSGSFEKISPGLLIDSHTSFGNLEFTFKFNNNNIVYLDAGSLNPDMDAYNKVSTNFMFSFNTFLCSCDNLAWLITMSNHGFSSNALLEFYETVTEEASSNICSGLSCVKTLAYLRKFLKKEQCNSKFTMDYFCQPITTTTTAIDVEDNGYSWYNRSDVVSGVSNLIDSHYLPFFILILSMFF